MKKLKELGFDRASIGLLIRYLRVYIREKPKSTVDTSEVSKLIQVSDGRLRKLLKKYNIYDIHLSKIRYGLDEYTFVVLDGTISAVEVVLTYKTLLKPMYLMIEL